VGIAAKGGGKGGDRGKQGTREGAYMVFRVEGVGLEKV